MKKRLAFAAMILTMGTVGIVCSAEETEPAAAVVQERIGGIAEPYAADHIELKLRNNNGYLEYRRWNATKGYWVDPYWIRLI